MHNLLQKFREIGNLSKENEQILLSALERVECPAKTNLQKVGKVCDAIYFVEKGIARTYYYKNGKDITYWIVTENDFVGAMASFFLREPSNKLVETIEPCILWKFEYEKLEALFAVNHEIERIARLFSNYGIGLLEKRADSLHFNSAKERYHILVEQQPDILRRVPLGMIASFLGITQETLSRIRKQV
ncbi:Crp/Fnr family transcriptional regulator [Aquimarina litoralis]|uniref:Crp/Fnr family transcriptional regulator n=1 Tax=Aquimarina litoralis TaxID=584605 RepID=UPI001C585BC6|nr:Crp/Fnr family transcriptional regulator [Aquimarina litoralis]MBW1298982.1 cyclic nucleotide-binding domain-containing protein [Aquimarina litoralis]